VAGEAFTRWSIRAGAADQVFGTLGIQASLVDMTDAANIACSVRPSTRLI
jgi:hypothetical protein